MNLKRLGVPVYIDKDGERYVIVADMKLALDHDKYERFVEKLKATDPNRLFDEGWTVLADWVENQF